MEKTQVDYSGLVIWCMLDGFMGHELIPKPLVSLYEFHEWRHALAILRHEFTDEFADIVSVLTSFRLQRSHIEVGGGRKSKVSESIDSALYQRGWRERCFDTRVRVDDTELASPTHSVDCFKNRIALEIEWNNKDPFFDRDLNNFRLLFDLRVISVGVIITRCDELQDVFKSINRGASFGASTTHMGKLLPRIEGGGGGGCPILVAGFGRLSTLAKTVCVYNVCGDGMRNSGTSNHPFAGLPKERYKTILADPPWQFSNRTGKMAPEHRRLSRYQTLTFQEIRDLPVSKIADAESHLYLWVPNALVLEGLGVMERWGFTYKTNLVWHKVRKDGGPDGRGVGFYFRNVTELVLFGVRGRVRTAKPGRTQVNFLATRKREHSRKPEELYSIIEACSYGPFLELFARHSREGWQAWGNEVDESPVSRLDREEQAQINPMYL